MTTENKTPREFYVHEAFKDTGTANWTVRETSKKPCAPRGYINDWVHVIEHSAYLAIKEQLEELQIRYKENFDEWTDRCDDLANLRTDWLESKKQLEEARVAIELLKKIKQDNELAFNYKVRSSKLEAENRRLRVALGNWINFENEEIAKEGPYVGAKINELINAGREALKGEG